MKTKMILGIVSLFCLNLVCNAGDNAGYCRPADARERLQQKEHKHRMTEQNKAGKQRPDKAEMKHSETKANKEHIQQSIQNRINTRQNNQEKRIQHGIKKGYLTQDEIQKLQQQQQNIASLEQQAFSDDKLTKDEAKNIKDAIQEASRCIWTEKHDTEGNQMPVYRLGQNVFAKDSLTSQLASENLSKEQAQTLLKDFKNIIELKQKLSTSDLNEEERNKLQSEYDNLLNQYFEVR